MDAVAFAGVLAILRGHWADAILPSVPASNPRPVTAGDLRALLRAAWSGAAPAELS